jgi:hypothetical protein
MSSITLIGAEIAAPILLANANDLSNSKVFRAVNTNTAPALLTIVDANDVVVGSTTLVAGGTLLFNKKPTDKVFAAATTVLLTPLAYPRG